MRSPASSRLPLLLLLLSLTVFFASAIFGQSESPPPVAPERNDGFIFREWYVDDGLPHNVINSAVRDKRGYLWVATLGGLARFDGRHFVEFKIPEEYMAGGYSYSIRALAVEDEETLVMITDGNKLVRLRNGVFTPHPAHPLLGGHTLRDVAVDSSGAVWIGAGTTPGTLLRWDGKSLQTFGAESGITSRGGRFCVVPGKSGRTWVAAANFLGWYEDGILRKYEGDPGQYLIIAPARSGGIWITANEHLAKLDDNGELKIIMSGKDWLTASQLGVRDLFETADGTLWIPTRRDTMLCLSDGALKRVPLQVERVLSLTDDIDGNLWLGTYGGGLVRATLRHHVLLNSDSGLPGAISGSVCEDEHGAIWCGNQAGGLVRVKDGKVSIATQPNGNIPYVGLACSDRHGRIWAHSSGGLLWTPSEGETDERDGQTRWIFRRSELPINNVQTFFSATNGDFWISWLYRHLGRLRDGKLHEYTADDGYPGERVTSIAERAGGEIWFGTERGRLFRLNKTTDKFEEQTLPGGSDSTRIFTLFVDTANRLWVGTTAGLLLWRGEQSRFFTRDDGLSDRLIYQIVEDEHGRLWMSSRRGIFYVSIKQLLGLADAPAGTQPARKVTSTLFGRDENLDGFSGMYGSQPMSWLSRDRRVWFVTFRGVVGFDTPEPSEDRRPPPIYINGVKVNGGAQKIPQPDKPMHVAANAAPIELRFSVLNFSAPERTRVRRMLEGFDLDWIDAGNEQSATYPRLAPGRYVFRVQADDADSGVMNQSETSLVIIVAAAWWQTPWAQLGAIFVFTVIVALIARRVSNRILRQRLRRLQRERALDHERTRIARDLHDELGGSMTKIGFVADKLQRRNNDPAQAALLQRLVGLAASLVEDLHKIIWTVNPKNDCWQNLAAYIARYAQRHLADTGVMCTVDGIETIPAMPLTPEVQHHLLALTKEALNNMLKHSQASRVRINLSSTGERFHMSIADNGSGFDTTIQSRGNGLANMRARMAEIDGNISITSQPGQGTKIELDVPFNCKQPLTN